MRFSVKIAALSLVWGLFVFWFISVPSAAAGPRAVKGILDLRSWDFSSQGMVSLSGQWEFYWQRHVPPGCSDARYKALDPVLVEAPACWNSYEIDGKKLPGCGIATYRLRVLLPESEQNIGFKFLDMATAFRMFVNGKDVYSAGIPGENSGTTTAAYRPGIVVFPQPHPEMEILVHVSNFSHWQGGLWASVWMGLGTQVTQYREGRLFREGLMFGTILIMGLYHLFLFKFRPQDKTSLYFALFCLMMAIRTFTHGERFACLLMPWIPFDILMRVMYISTYISIPVFVLFVRAVFPLDVKRMFVIGILILHGVAVMICLVTPPRIFSFTMPVVQVILIFVLCYGVISVWQFIRRKRQDASIFLAGFVIFSSTVINDILYTRQVFVSFPIHLAPYGLVTFTLFQAVLISKRFSRAFFTVSKQQKILEKEVRQRKIAEAAAAVAAEQEKYALVGQVAGKLAHDFNNILGAIMGHSELSLLDCEQEDIRRSLGVILEQTKQGRILTQNLVAFARDQEPREAWFNINEKIEMAVSLLRKDLQNVNLVMALDPKVPDLLADPGMIEQALVNLIQNAIHAMSLEPAPKLILKTSSGPSRIFIEIADNGCGIPEECHKDIFTPSFTLKGIRDEFGAYRKDIKGTGYGMANVKKCMDKHDAGISFTSRQGRGTSFVLSFPLPLKTKNDEPDSPKTSVKRGVSGKKILLVEDEDTISFVLEKIITTPPFSNEVVHVREAETAMARFDEGGFDLVSLDYLLPGSLTGLDVYTYIRETDLSTPVVFSSGNIHFIESIQALKANDPFLDHLAKPFENAEYAAIITKWLS